MGEHEGKGWRLSPLPLAQPCRSSLLAPQTRLEFCIPDCLFLRPKSYSDLFGKQGSGPGAIGGQ